MDASTCLVDGFGPLPVIRPTSADELGAAVRDLAAAGQVIYPVGGQTQLDLGMPPTRPGSVVEVVGLNRVIDYPARDMTITVEAGIRLSALQRLLADEGQWLPIDVPNPDRATLGGIVATNTSGSRRLGWGTLRDYVIGITTINDQGQQTKAGGRVVKNVAGYDLCKLHTGALGTLGIISQLTLKVRPAPEIRSLLCLACELPALQGLLDLLHQSRTRPTCLDVVNSRSTEWLRQQAGIEVPGQNWAILVGFEESEAAVSWQIGQLIREVNAKGIVGVHTLVDGPTLPLWQALAELTRPPQASWLIKVVTLPGQTAAVCRLADELPGQWAAQAHAGNGIVRLWTTTDLTTAQVNDAISRLTEAAGPQGAVTLPRCPSAAKLALPVWGKPPSSGWLMAQVKQQLDPHRLFNPGRFVAGI